MISIPITQFRRLSPDVQAAILGQLPMAPMVDELERYDGLTPLNPAQVAEFMRGVSQQSANILRTFADSASGEVPMTTVMRVGRYKTWQETRGFTAGLTKRIRSVSRDSDACFYGWRQPGDALEGAFYIHPTTHRSLQRYFASA